MASLKDRWSQALADANAKAESMTDEEINAQLRPATRRAFEAAENLDVNTKKLFAGVAGALGWIVGLGLMGWAVGAFVHLRIGPLWLVLALGAAVFLFVFLSTARARRSGKDVPYFAGMAGFLACSAAGEGMEDAAAVGLVFIAGVGLAHLFVRLPKPKAVTPTTPHTPDIPVTDGGTQADKAVDIL